MCVAFSSRFQRGTTLLLAQCRLVEMWERDAPARDRLEQRIGGELARRLVYALVRPQAGRGGSSSP